VVKLHLESRLAEVHAGLRNWQEKHHTGYERWGCYGDYKLVSNL